MKWTKNCSFVCQLTTRVVRGGVAGRGKPAAVDKKETKKQAAVLQKCGYAMMVFVLGSVTW